MSQSYRERFFTPGTQPDCKYWCEGMLFATTHHKVLYAYQCLHFGLVSICERFVFDCREHHLLKGEELAILLSLHFVYRPVCT